jgi:hypothetical protein
MLRPKFVQIPMAGSQALLVVISAMLRFHATGSWPAFTVKSQKRLSEQLECRCLKAPTPFRREIYGLTLGGNMMQ